MNCSLIVYVVPARLTLFFISFYTGVLFKGLVMPKSDKVVSSRYKELARKRYQRSEITGYTQEWSVSSKVQNEYFNIPLVKEELG
jgi:hypothetical protein